MANEPLIFVEFTKPLDELDDAELDALAGEIAEAMDLGESPGTPLTHRPPGEFSRCPVGYGHIMVCPPRRAVIAALLLPSVLIACGEDGSRATTAAPARTVEVTATEYAFNGDPGVITPGDTIEFAVDNVGQLDHSLEVLTSSGSSLGRTERIPAGSTATVTVTFDDAGVYRLICDVDDHLSRGQTASITVG